MNTLHTAMRPGARQERLLSGVFLLAVALRAYFLICWQYDPFAADPILDAVEYDLWAVNILDGRGLLPELQHHGPVYPLFLATLYSSLTRSVWVVYAAQAILGGLAAALTAKMAMDATRDARAGLAAGLAAAVAWPLVYYTGQALPPVLETCVVGFAMLLLGSEGRGSFVSAAAGLLMGVLCLSRPQMLTAVGLLTAAGMMRRRDPPKERRAWGAFALAALLPVLGWSAFVWWRTGVPVLVEATSGFNFYYGNHAGATGAAVLFPDLDYHALLFEVARKGFNGASGADSYFYAVVVEWMRSEPAAFAGLLLRKLALSIAACEIPTGEAHPWLVSGSFPVLRLFGYGALFALGLPGLLLGAADGIRPLRLHLLLFGSGLLYMVLTSVADRYRVPLMPSLAVGAGYLVHVCMRAGSRRPRFALAGAACTALLGASAAACRLAPQNPLRSHAGALYYLARAGGGQTAEAVRLLSERARTHPEDWDAKWKLGELLLMVDDPAQAERILTEVAVRKGAELPYVYTQLVWARGSLGDFRGAWQAASAAYAEDPHSLEDCLGARLFGRLAAVPGERMAALYDCPLAATSHHGSGAEIEALAALLTGGGRGMPEPELFAAALRIELQWLDRVRLAPIGRRILDHARRREPALADLPTH